ncbi:MAG TPA: N-acetyltransferase [Caulobacteraceae bacterium]|nr:N-acetyltransferase [Caulobacteraceae bacterium]
MSLAPATPAAPTLTAERRQDAAAVDALVLRAFGPGRFAKAAERLREGRAPVRPLSVVAWDDGEIVGCVRLWTVKVGETPAIFLGPIAVAPDYRRHGLGAALVEEACAAAAAAGHESVVLVGDVPFFGPLGFVAAPGVVMPGPVDQRRVLVRRLRAGVAEGLKGDVTAA